MKSVIVKARPLRCEIIDVPIPDPGPDEVLIKVIYCASNPRDWKAPDHLIPGVEIIKAMKCLELSRSLEAMSTNSGKAIELQQRILCRQRMALMQSIRLLL